MPSAVVDERPDFLPFLTDHRDDVERAVAVHVGNDGVDGARQRLQLVRLERPSAHVFQPQRLSLVVTKSGDRDIQIAIAVEIARSRVSHARDCLRRNVRRSRLRSAGEEGRRRIASWWGWRC